MDLIQRFQTTSNSTLPQATHFPRSTFCGWRTLQMDTLLVFLQNIIRKFLIGMLSSRQTSTQMKQLIQFLIGIFSLFSSHYPIPPKYNVLPIPHASLIRLQSRSSIFHLQNGSFPLGTSWTMPRIPLKLVLRGTQTLFLPCAKNLLPIPFSTWLLTLGS
eukprot:Rmarinus@m.13136